MSNPVDEQLSALADDELPATEAPLLLRRLAQDRSLQERWTRYHLIGDAMRGGLPPALDRGFAARVSEALTAEPAPGPAPNRWLRRAGGVAVAASVMVVALVTLRVDTPAPGPDQAVVTPTTANPQVPVNARFATAQGIHWERARPEVQRELNEYLISHSDAAVQDGEEAAR